MSQVLAVVASIDPKYVQEICVMAKNALGDQVSLGKIVDILPLLRQKVETFSDLSADQKVSALLDGLLSALTPAQKDLYESHLRNFVPSVLKAIVDFAPSIEEVKAVGMACLPFLGEKLKVFFPCLFAKAPVLEKPVELVLRSQPDNNSNLTSISVDPPVVSDQDKKSPEA
jgi:hypothetical protein